MNMFTKRKVVTFDLPLPKDIKILFPEQVILKFDKVGSIDVGALCYLHRGPNNRNQPNDSHLVDKSSFNHARAKCVESFIWFISEQFKNSGKRVITVHGKFQTFVTHFMVWADSNKHYEVLEVEDSARVAFREYVAYLKEQTLQNVISVNWAARLHEKSQYVLEEFLNIDRLSQGIKLIRRVAQATEPTKVPCEDDSSKILALSEALFRGFSQLVIDKMEFPFRLNIPHYLGYKDNGLWIFPLAKWCMPPYQSSDPEKLTRGCRAYDFVNGRLALLEQIEQRYKYRCLAKSALRSAHIRLSKANENHRDFSRRQAAMQANLAFVLLFIANTGMNLSQVFDLTWSADYKSQVERQGFRTIKWRAAGRVCQFEITAAFLPSFKHYLKLREYLLNGKTCDYLFITLGARKVETPKKMLRADLENYYRTLRIIDPNLPKVTARQWRTAKSDWLIRNTDPSTAAIILHNSEKTVLKHYADGSETRHLDEMSNFLNGVAETVVNKGQVIDQGIERSIGVCSSFGMPHQLLGNVPVIPDCHAPEGCLFCDKFKIHADDRDTRKLVSCRYCLSQTSHLVSSEEQFQKLFAPIFDRIKYLLDEINQRDEMMVTRILREVEEFGELDSYWANKLEMFTALELIV